MTSKLLFKAGDPYTVQAMRDTYDALEEIALNDLGLNIFPNQIMVIESAEMLDAYNGFGGMPITYHHWKFGLQRKKMQRALNNGDMGLAYELVIGSNPCISYNMASNGMAMMALVMAHAAFGHNHVYKNNYLFRKHAHPEGIMDYAQFAQNFVTQMEEEHGIDNVEEILDAAHSLMLPGGVFHNQEPPAFSLKEERRLHAERMRQREQNLDYTMLATVPGLLRDLNEHTKFELSDSLYPQENILYFLEKHSPTLKPWQRELVRIVRIFAQQIFYPMVQTNVVHEGAASFCHYYLLQKLHEKGRIDDGTWMRIITSHTGVLRQGWMRRFSEEKTHVDLASGARHNPYTLGFAICQDIVRISTNPTGEDRKLFKWAGKGNWRDILKDAWANYRDETFILQFLSPKVMRDFRMFVVRDQGNAYRVESIHNEDGFDQVRCNLGRAHSYEEMFPRIEVADADMKGDHSLILRYQMRDKLRLNEESKEGVLHHLGMLWGDYAIQIVNE